MSQAIEQFEAELISRGRIHGPEILFWAWLERRISSEVLTAFIGTVWSRAEYPQSAMRQQEWRELFGAAGFTVTGKGGYGVATERPAVTTRLYRGSVPSLRRRWSWTSDPDLASRFASGFAAGGFNGRMPGQVYVVDAPPASLLCRIDRESEYVVDTRGLNIREGI